MALISFGSVRRTVVNPFSVNEIAEALKGVDIPVLVKNPVNPDLLLVDRGTGKAEPAGHP